MRASVGVAELAAAVHATTACVRYHCLDPRGMLYGDAFKEGRSWRIPVDSADRFIRDYQRFASLHHKRNKKGPATPPVAGPTPDAISRERKDELGEE